MWMLAAPDWGSNTCTDSCITIAALELSPVRVVKCESLSLYPGPNVIGPLSGDSAGVANPFTGTPERIRAPGTSSNPFTWLNVPRISVTSASVSCRVMPMVGRAMLNRKCTCNASTVTDEGAVPFARLFANEVSAVMAARTFLRARGRSSRASSAANLPPCNKCRERPALAGPQPHRPDQLNRASTALTAPAVCWP